MKMNLKKGFTLIELLVVVAIIGILASVVLASLNTARNKGKDASVQSSMSSMRAQAELGVNASGQYAINLCGVSTTGGLLTLINAAVSAGATDVNCAATGATNLVTSPAWAVEALLPTGGTNYFCVDSTGFAGAKTASSILNTTAAPANDLAQYSTSADVTC